jgi:hypothetical protein
MDLCTVPCGTKKIWDENPNAGPTLAKDVYIDPFAKKCREYAQKFYPSSWCVLSAKYGFLFPDEIIEGPYNVSFNDKKTNPISIEALAEQAEEKGLNSFNAIIVLGGRNYVNTVKKAFPDKSIHTPLADCRGIGYMLQKLSNSIKSGVPL